MPPAAPSADSTLNPEKITLDDTKRILEESHLRHIAIIMDGNRRWAKDKGMPSAMGHAAGVDSLKKIVRYASDAGLEALTVYAFSTENWNRKAEEVGFLMKLFAQALLREINELHENKVRIRFIGDLAGLPSDLQPVLEQAMEKTAQNPGLRFQVATNYGARAELVNACRQIAQSVQSGQLNPADITEETLQRHLYTVDVPDPDLVIRTGGEMRLSNYLLWQCAYAEFYATDVMWPAFSIAEFNRAILEFANRQRRFGQ